MTNHSTSRPLLPVLFVLAALFLVPRFSLRADASGAGWYFYIWDSSANSGGDVGEFQTTSQSGVYVLQNAVITASSGFNFGIHNSGWSTTYGWSESVTATGTTFSVASASGATGWSTLPAGTYDITFNLPSLTVRFDLPGSSQESQELIYADGNTLRWKADNSEVRLFGASYCLPSACDFRAAGYVGMSTLAQKKSMIAEDMDHYRRMGFDAIRLSFYGDYENTDAQGNLVDNDHLDLLCTLIKEATDRGIYMMLTPVIGYDSRWPENEYTSSVDASGTGFARNYTSSGGKWQLLFTSESPHGYAKTYIRQLLQHTNPYTGRQLKDEPNILLIELLNEPFYADDLLTYKSSYTNTYRTAINSLVEAVRATGCQKPVFMNVSQDFHVSDIVNGSNADGGTYAWYPQSVSNRYRVDGNGLLWVDRYEQLLTNNSTYPFNKPRAVYEFDTADNSDGYMLPAMTREFRRGNVQFASLYAYDPLRMAPYNNSNRTHYFNMVFTPQKAVSAMIAAEVMRQQEAGQANPYYPQNSTFGNVLLDYNQRLAVLNDGTHFYHSNTTTEQPSNKSTLKHIAGCGSSPVVAYDGTGIYFLDRNDKGTWTLEVYPDITELSDPFKGFDRLTDITSPAAVRKTSPDSHVMAISLPTLSGVFNIEPGIYTFNQNTVTAQEELPAKSFYDSLANLSDPDGTLAEDGSSSATKTVVLTTATDDQWTRCHYSRTFHSPATTMSIDWNGSTRKHYYNLTVSSLENSTDYTNYGNYPDATLSIYVGDRTGGQMDNPTFTLNAKGTSNNTKALFCVVDSEGRAWGKTITLKTSSYSNITVTTSELQPVKAAMLPQDWPGVNSYWYPASVTNTTSFADAAPHIEYIQLSIRSDLYTSGLSSDHGFSLESVKMNGTAALTLDENATATALYQPGYYNLQLVRTFNPGEWNTLCLPVWLTKEEVETAFGEGTEVVELTGETDGELDFRTVSTYTVANKPYLIKPVQTIMSPLSNIWATAWSPADVTAGNYIFRGCSRTEPLPMGMVFTLQAEPSCFGTNTSQTTIGATHAWLSTTVTPDSDETLILGGDCKIDDTPQLPTRIDGVLSPGTASDTSTPLYNLHGQRLSHDATAMPHGIYIRGNKKVAR